MRDSNSMSISFGVVGLGNMGRIHAKNIYKNPEAELKEVADVEEEKAKELASEITCNINKDYKDMLAIEEIDAVVISTPVSTHKEIAVNALKAGKHVFCEKPLSLSTKEGIEILKATKKSNKIFQIGFNRRFDQGYKQAKKLWKKVK